MCVCVCVCEREHYTVHMMHNFSVTTHFNVCHGFQRAYRSGGFCREMGLELTGQVVFCSEMGLSKKAK